MAHDMYLLSFSFVFISVSEQLGILNDLFLIIDKEINMHGTVMHHIRFNFFCQLSIEQILDIIFVLDLQC